MDEEDQKDKTSNLIDALRGAKIRAQKIPRGVAMSGTYSTDVPMGDDDNLSLGVRAGATLQPGNVRVRPEGLNATYRTGDQSFGLGYNRPNQALRNEGAPLPRWMLNYKREF